MKNFLFSSFFALLLSCSQTPNHEAIQSVPLDKNGNTITQIKFDYYEFDAGEVEEGTAVEYEFPFTNIGDEPLVIYNCKSSCGCVVPECPKKPIEPGGSGIFWAKFDTKSKRGKQTKTLTMTANTEPPNMILRLFATVIPKE